ncbi:MULTISPECIES: hypothetical protein [Geobacillus]|uniref:Uncharacterized protein n=1 Tax=Geobacillus stearothermophilus TaxID=1422 RepID=A0A916NWD7_GEOSE|nr:MULTISPECIES: hypothetical protein [Geobacillus]KZM56291.1 hypothetical protein A3Q36_06005 [Geobacillus stearothermophilus]TWG24958.1 hypothetical protein GC56T2_3548 [Geobacillus sp. C56-T2]CAP08233.1 hypothetical protein pGS18_ORF22 [Geobacillus stearothermophilus]
MQITLDKGNTLKVEVEDVNGELKIFCDGILLKTIRDKDVLLLDGLVSNKRLDFKLKSFGNYKCVIKLSNNDKILYQSCPSNWETGDPAWEDTVLIVVEEGVII